MAGIQYLKKKKIFTFLFFVQLNDSRKTDIPHLEIAIVLKSHIHRRYHWKALCSMRILHGYEYVSLNTTKLNPLRAYNEKNKSFCTTYRGCNLVSLSLNIFR